MLTLTLSIAGLVPYSLPIQCTCGFLLQNNDNLTQTSCSNKFGCPTESGYKILAMLKQLRISCGLGEVLCEDIAYRAKNYKHHLDIFRLEFSDLYQCQTGVASKVSQCQDQLKEINNNGGISLATYIALYYFKNFGETYANKVFEDYDDLNKFYQEVIDNNSLDPKIYISTKLNISYTTDTVKNILNYLIMYRDILLENIELFNIKKSHDKTVRICITGAITRCTDDNGEYFKPRERFADFLSDKFKINVIIEKSASKNVEYVVCDSNTGSRKAKAAGNRLVTSDTLMNILSEINE